MRIHKDFLAPLKEARLPHMPPSWAAASANMGLSPPGGQPGPKIKREEKGTELWCPVPSPKPSNQRTYSSPEGTSL